MELVKEFGVPTGVVALGDSFRFEWRNGDTLKALKNFFGLDTSGFGSGIFL